MVAVVVVVKEAEADGSASVIVVGEILDPEMGEVDDDALCKHG